MCEREANLSKERLERMRFLREERDRHVDLLEKLNFRVSFGAAVVLATAAFGADDLGRLGEGLGDWIWLCGGLMLVGAACVTAGLIIHWNFRDSRAERCAKTMRRIAVGEPGWEEFTAHEDAFDALPAPPAFSWLLAIGVIAVLASTAILVVAALAT